MNYVRNGDWTYSTGTSAQFGCARKVTVSEHILCNNSMPTPSRHNVLGFQTLSLLLLLQRTACPAHSIIKMPLLALSKGLFSESIKSEDVNTPPTAPRPSCLNYMRSWWKRVKNAILSCSFCHRRPQADLGAERTQVVFAPSALPSSRPSSGQKQ